MGIIDEPTIIRKGEELDPKHLISFLKDTIEGVDGDIEVKQFPNGFSNLTYFIRSNKLEFVLRKPPIGKKAKTAHDMSREYNILKALKPVFPYVPTPLVYSEDLSIVGSPFYVMERLKGVILRKNPPKDLQFTPKDANHLCDNLISVLCELHHLDYKKIGLETFGKPKGYVKRQVEGWSNRYIDARTSDAPDYETVMQWLHDNMPPESDRVSVIHNDYKFDNVVLRPDNPLQIIGILDWEMATIGDPLMDLGASLAYWINASDPDKMRAMRRLPTTIDGMLTRQELVKLYIEKSGFPIESFDFYYCFGVFRLAVIAQQIYYRYFHGQNKDERFKMLIFVVHILEEAAKNILETRHW